MTHEDYLQQAKDLGAVSMRVFRIEIYEFGIGRKWIPFSYHFFDCFDLEICYYIDELKDHVSMFVFEEQGMKRREWSEEFKNNPAYELVDLKISTMKTFYFNTGVRPFDHNPPAGMAFMKGFKDSGNGVYVIPFDCEDVPDNAIFQYACDHVIPGDEHLLKREMFNTALVSKYAFFLIPKT